MKTVFGISFLLLSSIVIFSFDKLPRNSLKDLFVKITNEYTGLKAKTPHTYEVMDSWLYEEGVRSRYAIIKSVASLKHFETLSSIPVFLRGPHSKQKFNYSSQGTFGYYNPAFLEEFESEMKLFFKSRQNRRVAQVAYDKYFRRVVRSYFDAYNMLHPTDGGNITVLNSNIDQLEALLLVDMRRNDCSMYYEVFRPYADQEEGKGKDWYEAFTAPGFWVRRKVDGTDKQIHGIMIYAMKQLDPNYLK